MTPSTGSHIFNGVQALSNSFGAQLVHLTKSLNDVAGSTGVDFFMDSAKGLGHRVVHGHSLENLPLIYQKFGFKGVGDYFLHGFRDVMSPHGMPMPFAKNIEALFGLNRMTSVNWLSFNIADVFTGGLSVAHSAYNFFVFKEAIVAGLVSQETLISTAVGAAVKILSGSLTSNAVTLGSGVFDLGLVLWATIPGLAPEPATPSTVGVMKLVAAGGLCGAASAALVGGALYAPIEPTTRTWLKRMQKITFSGAVGGAIGAGSSVLSTHPVAISSASVGGYVAGEWLFDRMKIVSDRFSSRRKAADFLPEFLANGYSPAM